MPTNSQDLTYAEWLAASGCQDMDSHILRKAWREGQDPTEWRAAREALNVAYKVD